MASGTYTSERGKYIMVLNNDNELIWLKTRHKPIILLHYVTKQMHTKFASNTILFCNNGPIAGNRCKDVMWKITTY